MRALRVNETKLNFQNAFIADLFEFGGEKESKYDIMSLFMCLLVKSGPVS